MVKTYNNREKYYRKLKRLNQRQRRAFYALTRRACTIGAASAEMSVDTLKAIKVLTRDEMQKLNLYQLLLTQKLRQLANCINGIRYLLTTSIDDITKDITDLGYDLEEIINKIIAELNYMVELNAEEEKKDV